MAQLTRSSPERIDDIGLIYFTTNYWSPLKSSSRIFIFRNICHSFVLTSRRLNYLHIILNRSDDELTKQIYDAQKIYPTKGDWAQNAGEDMKKGMLDMEESHIVKMKKICF